MKPEYSHLCGQTRGRRQSILLVLLLFVTAMQLSVGFMITRDPWTDEAMLATNILSLGHEITGPMPYYNQAAPIGYTFIARLANMADALSNQIFILRFISIVSILIGLIAVITALYRRRGSQYAVAFVFLALSSPLIWRYSSEIKHYGLEFMAGSLIMVSGWRLASQDNAGAHALFVSSALLGSLAAFTAPIIICAALSAAFIMRATRMLNAKQRSEAADAPHPLSARLIGTGALSAASILAIYFLINKPLLIYNSSAYAYIYDRGKFDFTESSLYNVKLGIRYFSIVLEPFGFSNVERVFARILPFKSVPYALSAIAGAALLALLIVSAFRSGRYFALTFLSATAISVLLNAAGLLAFDQARHFLFLAPVTLTLAAIALVGLWRAGWRRLAAGPRRTVAGLATAALVAAIMSGAYRQATSLNQEVSPLLSFAAERDVAVPIWVYCGAQPAANLLARPGTRFVGTLDRASSPVAWEIRGGCMSKTLPNEPVFKANPAYVTDLAAVAARQTAIWLLFAHDFYDPERQSYLSVVEASLGRCETARQSVGAILYYCSVANK